MTERRQHPRRDVLTDAEADRVADVFTEHRRFIESVARQHSPHPQDVPDIVQAVGVQVCRGLNGFREESEIRTWLYRVTVNTAREHYRREQRQVLRVVEALQTRPVPAPVVDPDEEAIAAERSRAVREGIGQIRNGIERRTGRVLDYQQILRDEIEHGTVQPDQKLRRWRARQQLKHILTGDPRID